MERINFEAYVNYLHNFCGVQGARNLACKIFSENYPTQKISFTPRRKTMEVEDCKHDPNINCWIPTGKMEKIIS